MSKVYKGYELIKAIADGEIKEGSRFIFRNGDEIDEVIWNGENLIYKDNDNCVMSICTDIELINGIFELIEYEIDIDNIEELYVNEKDEKIYSPVILEDRKTINALLKWAKQADKEIKELKSLDIEISEKDINEAIKKARFKKEIKQLNKEIKSIKEKNK